MWYMYISTNPILTQYNKASPVAIVYIDFHELRQAAVVVEENLVSSWTSLITDPGAMPSWFCKTSARPSSACPPDWEIDSRTVRLKSSATVSPTDERLRLAVVEPISERTDDGGGGVASIADLAAIRADCARGMASVRIARVAASVIVLLDVVVAIVAASSLSACMIIDM